MFKRFGKSSKILSLMLALIMVFGLTSTVLAISQGDGILDIWATNGNIHAEMNAVEVGGVTRYTGYIEFPENSAQDLSQVEIKAAFLKKYNLEVNGVNYQDNMPVDFSKGYVDFKLKNKNGTEFRNYKINAGIKGQDINLTVEFNFENAVDWYRGNYSTPGSYNPPVRDNLTEPAAIVIKRVLEELYPGLHLDNEQELVEPIEIRDLKVKVGTTAMDATKYAAADVIKLVGADSGYISEIGKYGGRYTLPDRIFQRTIGAPDFPEDDYMKDRTGWIFKVNNEVANMGASQYKLSETDSNVSWGYTFDWGVDLGGPEW